MDLSDLADRADGDGIRGRRTFVVGAEHATNVFGEQADPPGLPAAADAAPGESVRVLGSPDLLATCEFVARQSLRGHLPDGTGTVGESADLAHRRAAPVGSEVLAETVLEGVDAPRIELRGRVARTDREGVAPDDPGAVVGTVGMTFRVVDRDRFREAVGPDA